MRKRLFRALSLFVYGGSCGQRRVLRGNETEWFSQKRRKPVWSPGAGKQARFTAAKVVLACSECVSWVRWRLDVRETGNLAQSLPGLR